MNSKYYECVNCTGINLPANIAKYIASIYLPLAIAFAVIILFDIRLTTGPANAFILYSQVVSSIFSLDADGQVKPVANIKTYQDLLKGYRVVYGIFNLEFVENLLPPFCFSSNFNALSVLLLDYGVAVFPLLMIIVIVLCLRLKECFSGAADSCGKRLILRRYRCSCRKINEALLPAFATFILLSYTKFSLTSSYISSTQSLIDEYGKKANSLRVYFAGQMSTNDTQYKYQYFLPSIIVTIFVCVIPVLLLHYPLRVFEWLISKVTILWKFYPIDRVHVFLDTFQGCYRNNMRFFAGLYFLFRLVLNVIYTATGSWLQQYIAQQIVCVVMITLVAICRPYNKENWIFNYVDVLIFADLAIINALTLYLYTIGEDTNQIHSVSTFVFQYVLVFLPLIFMVGYVFWYLITRQNALLKSRLFCCLKHPTKPLYQSIQRQNGVTLTRSELAVDDLNTEDEDEAFFARAEATNHFHQVNANNGSGSIEVHDCAQPEMEIHREDDAGQSMLKTSDSRKTFSTGSTVSKGYGSFSSDRLSSNSSHSRGTMNNEQPKK